MRESTGRGVRIIAGLALGAATAWLELAYLLGGAFALLVHLAWPRHLAGVRASVLAGAGRLADVERRRLVRFLGLSPAELPERLDHERALGYLVWRAPLGLLGGLVLGLLAFGLAAAGSMLLAWTTGFPWSFLESGGVVETETIALAAIPGAVLLFLNLTGILGVAELERRLARRRLAPTDRERYEQRITELASSRAAVVDAVNEERRRIERDLHDGVQQSLVALGMLLGRARRSRTPEKRAELLAQAHVASQHALDELRDVAWRIYPSALDDGGLAAAVETIAERSPLPISLTYDLRDRPPHQVEAVAYFVVSEAVTNAVKHAGARRLELRVESLGVLGERPPARGREKDQERGGVAVEVRDDGCGGADPGGTGLSGLARRVAALDGTFEVRSPVGGPTTIRAELPCG